MQQHSLLKHLSFVVCFGVYIALISQQSILKLNLCESLETRILRQTNDFVSSATTTQAHVCGGAELRVKSYVLCACFIQFYSCFFQVPYNHCRLWFMLSLSRRCSHKQDGKNLKIPGKLWSQKNQGSEPVNMNTQ